MLTVYSVIYTDVDNLLQNHLDNIYPNQESAVRAAKKLAKQNNIYEVQVNQDEVTEEYGRHWLRTIYREKYEDKYLERNEF